LCGVNKCTEVNKFVSQSNLFSDNIFERFGIFMVVVWWGASYGPQHCTEIVDVSMGRAASIFGAEE
jgi:hypothetical protein